MRGLARTGRLVTSAAIILFLAFISLSRVPVTDVKILATALALGIVIDATVVRGVLAPALVAALGRANWWPGGQARPSAPSGAESGTDPAGGRREEATSAATASSPAVTVSARSTPSRSPRKPMSGGPARNAQ